MAVIPVDQRGYTNPQLLAETDWLAKHMDDPAVRIVDARPPQQYAAGHIPGAVNLPGTNGIPRTADGEMASPEEFSSVAGKLGIGNGGTIIVYDIPNQHMGLVAWAFLLLIWRNSKWRRKEKIMYAFRLVSIAMSIASLSTGLALAADPATVEWNGVPTKTVTLFYPAQSTYQWIRSLAHPGAPVVTGGGACLTCHNGAEEKLGNKLVTANPLEPTPVAGKNGVIQLNLQIAYDNENAYFRAQWKTRNPYPGDAHPFVRYDGKEWKPYGFPKLDAVVQKGEQPGIYEDRFSIMIDDGGVPAFANQGCWLTCHNGARDNPKFANRAAVEANPLYQALKQNDVRKYLPSTRTDTDASWDKGKSPDEIAPCPCGFGGGDHRC